MRPVVHILLSSYNGERYIRHQLESLLKQSYSRIQIHIRDDGSTDSTPSILAEIANENPQIKLRICKNVGVIPSFLDLLEDVESSSDDLFAFCDQDDEWFPDKVSRAVDTMTAQNRPADTLYFTGLTYTNENLVTLRASPQPRKPGFGNAVVENVVTGCTMVIGQGIRQKVLRASPDKMMMHDWWIYLVASAFGHVVYDHEPSLLYRQHGNNVSGWESSFSVRIKNRSQEFLNRWIHGEFKLQSVDQAAEFLSLYQNELPNNAASILKQLLAIRWGEINFIKRASLAFSGKIWRNRLVDNFVLLLLILLSRV